MQISAATTRFIARAPVAPAPAPPTGPADGTPIVAPTFQEQTPIVVPVKPIPRTGQAAEAAEESRRVRDINGPARLAAHNAGNVVGKNREAAFGEADPETEAVREAWGRRANSHFRRGSNNREFAEIDGRMVRQGWGDRTERGRGERIRFGGG